MISICEKVRLQQLGMQNMYLFIYLFIYSFIYVYTRCNLAVKDTIYIIYNKIH